jgi:hypothetical protein
MEGHNLIGSDMRNPTGQSRELARRLDPGIHDLSNQDLRSAYGVRRMTAKTRSGIAQELERVGLEILSDPAYEPLRVRKTAPERPLLRRRLPHRKVWWQRPWVIGTAAVLLLLMIAGALGDEPTRATSDREPTAAATTTATTPTEATPSETTPAEPVATFADAEDAVEDGDFSEAVAIAAALGANDRDRIRRKISRTIARDIRRALRNGDRSAAKMLISEAGRYPSTPQIRAARSSYRAAKARAAQRAAARRAAREAARQRAAERRAARRAAREAAQAAAAAEADVPTYEDSNDAPDVDVSGGPSTTNWCGKRDGDGDGIYCE